MHITRCCTMQIPKRSELKILVVLLLTFVAVLWLHPTAPRNSETHVGHVTGAHVHMRGLTTPPSGRVPPRPEEEQRPTVDALLESSSPVPRVVYYLWCHKKTPLKFHNYLAVMSAVAFLQPRRIKFFYGDDLPYLDSYAYNAWFDRLKASVHYFEVVTAPRKVCGSAAGELAFVRKQLKENGGIFAGVETIFTSGESARLFHNESTNNVDLDRRGFAIARRGDDLDLMSTRVHYACVSSSEYRRNLTASQQSAAGRCVYSESDRIYPKDFWKKDDMFSRLVNYLMYGSAQTPVPKPSTPGIPNIAHMLWIGGGTIDYLFYLSCLSLIYVVEVDRLYIHGDAEPKGQYWPLLTREPKLKFLLRSKPNFVYGYTIKNVQAMSDLFRVEIMLEHGGLYSDVDVIWTKRPDEELFRYDAVASYDWAHAFVPYPDYINLGVSMGRRGAPFWKLLLESMRTFREDVFGFNGLLQVYKVYEANPGALLIDTHLQTMCYKTSCFPIWGVKDAEVDWRKDTCAYHWTWPTPTEFRNEAALVNATGKWADIGRNVLYKSGVLTRPETP